MELAKHTLVNDFPEHQHTIRHLKMHDKHFAKLFDQYHQIENQVHKIEQDNGNTADDYLEALKKQRVALKDQLYGLILTTEKAL